MESYNQTNVFHSVACLMNEVIGLEVTRTYWITRRAWYVAARTRYLQFIIHNSKLILIVILADVEFYLLKLLSLLCAFVIVFDTTI